MRKHERPLATTPRFAHHLLGKQLVDPPVALIPGPVRAVIEHRRFRQVPEVMLNEPEQRVGNGVVVQVVGESRRIDPTHLEAGAIRRFNHHRFSAAPRVELGFESISRRCHPHRSRGLRKA